MRVDTDTNTSSFRPLPLMKGCRWMTYLLTLHTISIHMNLKTNKLKTMLLELGSLLKRSVCLNYELKMLHH